MAKKHNAPAKPALEPNEALFQAVSLCRKAGAFEMAGGYSRKNTSRILNGVLEFMQKQGYEILDVQLSPSGMGDSLLCCLVLITYK